MALEVLLMRHGTASWDAATDSERRLTERGEAEVEAARQWLAESDWQPEQIWHSPYQRARQTTSIINREWGLKTRVIASISPDNSLLELETILATFRGERLMLIGHNPLFSNAIAHWEGESQRYWGLQPASMALLEADVFAAGCGSLQWLRHYPNYQHNGR